MASLTCNFTNFTTYNLYGFNQGETQLRDLCSTSDIIAVQEHWLAKHYLELYNFHDSFQGIAKSAMTKKLEFDILVGLAILIKSSVHVKNKLY